ncbi:DUF917 family protein [Candidatus Bipolaricaulota bacterium]|nr:DUF917 family protein [Candidatus Bipolaricaulota bacterium]
MTGQIDREWIEAAIVGGGILGGGGGGSMSEGRSLGRLALELGDPRMVDLAQLPEDSLILVVSAVGAPSVAEHPMPSHYVRAVSLMLEELKGKVGALMTNEIGGLAVVNGLVQSAIVDLPLVDAACNGRAHPTGVMGAMGISLQPGYVVQQVTIGGSQRNAKYVELCCSGSLSIIAQLTRKLAEELECVVAAARTPILPSFVRANAAVGAIGQAVELGKVWLACDSGAERIEQVTNTVNGKVVARGKVESLTLAVRNGFDVGELQVGDVGLTFWNEYMTLEHGSERLATFPDLIATMDAETGHPITTAEIREGQEIAVMTVSQANLNLGGGMRDRGVFRDIERILGKEIVKYVCFDGEAR